jgi:hypothetical protein
MTNTQLRVAARELLKLSKESNESAEVGSDLFSIHMTCAIVFAGLADVLLELQNHQESKDEQSGE